MRVAVGRGPDAGVAVAVPGVVDLEPRGAVVPPELPRHRVGRVARLVRAVVGDVIDAVPLVQVGLCEVSMLPSIACTQLQVESASTPSPHRGRGPRCRSRGTGSWSPAGPCRSTRSRPTRGSGRTSSGPSRRTGPARWACRRTCRRRRTPTRGRRSAARALVAAEVQRRAAVRAVLLHQADPAAGVAERDQVLAEQPHPGGRAARLRDLRRQAGRRPVPAQQLAHQRPGTHPGQDLVVFRPATCHILRSRSPPQSYQFIY